MRTYSQLSIVVTHDCLDADENGTFVEMANGHSSMEVSSFESALAMLPPGSKVQVFAKGTIGNKTVHHLSRVIRESCVLVALDLSEVTECSRICESPFQGNPNLLVIRFPNNLVAINPRAFAECTSLEAVSIPKTCVLIEKEAFKGCPKLTHIEFADAENWFAEFDGVVKPVASLHDAHENSVHFSARNGKFASCRLFKPAAEEFAAAAS